MFLQKIQLCLWKISDLVSFITQVIRKHFWCCKFYNFFCDCYKLLMPFFLPLIFFSPKLVSFIAGVIRKHFRCCNFYNFFRKPCKSYHYSCSWQKNPQTRLVKLIFLQLFSHWPCFSFLYFFSHKLVSFMAGVIRKHFRCCKFYNFSHSLVNLTTIVVVGWKIHGLSL